MPLAKKYISPTLNFKKNASKRSKFQPPTNEDTNKQNQQKPQTETESTKTLCSIIIIHCHSLKIIETEKKVLSVITIFACSGRRWWARQRKSEWTGWRAKWRMEEGVLGSTFASSENSSLDALIWCWSSDCRSLMTPRKDLLLARKVLCLIQFY